MAFKPALISFNGGEIGPETLARTDLENYLRCAEVVENVFVYPQGKIAKAPGTRFIGECLAGENVQLRPFVYSVGDNLVMVLSDNAMQIIRGDTFVEIEGAVATLGGWQDESAAPSSGGGDAPVTPGGTPGDDLGTPSDDNWYYIDDAGKLVMRP